MSLMIIGRDDELELGPFSVAGRSGGGPHALACAARLPDRVQRTALLVSVAPSDAANLDWHDGMTELNLQDYSDVDGDMAGTLTGDDPLTAALDPRAAGLREDPDSLIRYLLPELTASDRRIVEDRVMRDLLTATYAEAVRRGSGGWIDDAIALRTPWKFQFDDVKCPVLLWHGVDDRPPAGFDERIHTYEIHIASAAVAHSAFRQRWDEVEAFAQTVTRLPAL
jgi:pimeloyl-ACP methyl ester carboxylesterase